MPPDAPWRAMSACMLASTASGGSSFSKPYWWKPGQWTRLMAPSLALYSSASHTSWFCSGVVAPCAAISRTYSSTAAREKTMPGPPDAQRL